jgi:hypothetical protein
VKQASWKVFVATSTLVRLMHVIKIAVDFQEVGEFLYPVNNNLSRVDKLFDHTFSAP